MSIINTKNHNSTPYLHVHGYESNLEPLCGLHPAQDVSEDGSAGVARARALLGHREVRGRGLVSPTYFVIHRHKG